MRIPAIILTLLAASFLLVASASHTGQENYTGSFGSLLASGTSEDGVLVTSVAHVMFWHPFGSPTLTINTSLLRDTYGAEWWRDWQYALIGGKLVVISGRNPTILHVWDGPTLESHQALGSNRAILAGASTASGWFYAVVSENVITAEGDHPLEIVRRSPEGAWSVESVVLDDTGGPTSPTKAKAAMAEHTDGSVWLLGHYDSKHYSFTIRLTPTSTTINPLALQDSVYGDLSPEVEFPSFAVTRDGNKLAFLYQNQDSRIHSGSPFRKDARLQIAYLDTAGSFTFSASGPYVERVDHVGILNSADGLIALGYPFRDPLVDSYQADLWAYQVSAGWQAEMLDELVSGGTVARYLRNGSNFVTVEGEPDVFIRYLFAPVALPTATPTPGPPTPTPTPTQIPPTATQTPVLPTATPTPCTPPQAQRCRNQITAPRTGDGGLRWPGKQAQNLIVYDYTTSPLATQAVAEAVAGWNISPVVQMTIERPGGACNTFPRRAISVCETPALCGGSANLFHKPNGSHIEGVFIQVGTCDGQADYGFLLWVACQELGHGLGLDHQFADDSCMGNIVYGYPNAHDYEQLEGLVSQGVNTKGD